MMLFYFILIFLQFAFSRVKCVPATPSNAFLEDLKSIKEKFTSMSSIIEKWNLIYTTQVEPRVVSATTTLTSIDSNIKNLQERAHVWDTFQLHVSAWNEQMSTTDRKLDIISKAQEEILAAEAKISAVGNLDYKIEALSKKLDTTLESITELSKKVDVSLSNRDPLFGEFAVRGILSTLKQFERKLDKIQVNSQTLLKQSKMDDLETRSKLTINCNTPPIVEELLTDVSSKVDVIFDKMNGKYEDEVDEDYADTTTDDASKVIREAKHNDDAKLVRKFVKRINQPCKDFNTTMIDVKETLEMIRNTTELLLEKSVTNQVQVKTDLCLNDEKILLKLDHLFNHLNYTDTTKDMAINSYFKEQQNNFESFLNKKLPVFCMKNDPEEITETPTTIMTFTTPVIEETKHAIFYKNDTNECSNLSVNDKSGIYIFGNNDDFSANHWEYTKRLCEFDGEHHWTVIQKRGTFYNKVFVDFNKNWETYKRGFGDFRGEFWYGNEYIHRLTAEQDMILRIVLENFEGNVAFAEYDIFKIASEKDNYRITVGGYSGNASDSLSSHNFSQFSTVDRKNDEAPECCPCADSYGGGWWFNSCFEANLNGIYHANPTNNDYYRGIIWETWLGNYSLKKSKMLIRKKPTDYTTSHTTTYQNIITTGIPLYLEDP